MITDEQLSVIDTMTVNATEFVFTLKSTFVPSVLLMKKQRVSVNTSWLSTVNDLIMTDFARCSGCCFRTSVSISLHLVSTSNPLQVFNLTSLR